MQLWTCLQSIAKPAIYGALHDVTIAESVTIASRFRITIVCGLIIVWDGVTIVISSALFVRERYWGFF